MNRREFLLSTSAVGFAGKLGLRSTGDQNTYSKGIAKIVAAHLEHEGKGWMV